MIDTASLDTLIFDLIMCDTIGYHSAGIRSTRYWYSMYDTYVRIIHQSSSGYNLFNVRVLYGLFYRKGGGGARRRDTQTYTVATTPPGAWLIVSPPVAQATFFNGFHLVAPRLLSLHTGLFNVSIATPPPPSPLPPHPSPLSNLIVTTPLPPPNLSLLAPRAELN